MKSNTSFKSAASKLLPARPDLEHLKNEAKRRLDAMRASAPGTQLAEAQFQLAREYGFTSWRELKAEVDRHAGVPGVEPLGDWIGEISGQTRVAVHIRKTEHGAIAATVDSRDYGSFEFPANILIADRERLSFTVALPSPGGTYEALYEGKWDVDAGKWAGEWKAHGVAMPLSFVRGVFPPAPAIAGIDGIWDGRLGTKEGMRLTFHIKTGGHGTFAWCDNPERNSYGMPAASITRQGDLVTINMKTMTVVGELRDEARRIEARFVRGDIALPLMLQRRPAGAAAPRAPEPVVKVAPAVLDTYAGVYAFAPGRTITVTVQDGRLYAQYPNQPQLELFASSQTEFFWRVLEVRATFQVDADGRAASVIVHQKGRDTRALRVS